MVRKGKKRIERKEGEKSDDGEERRNTRRCKEGRLRSVLKIGER
jgi:hypothetical protein